MKKDVFGLSKPQEAIWLTGMYFNNSNINYITTAIDFSSKTDNIDFKLLKKALNHVIKSNDNFQTRIFIDNGTVKQYFCDFENIDFPIHEIASLNNIINEQTHKNTGFHLLEKPLYEFKIYKINGRNTGGILCNFHQLICDEYTAELFIKQIIYIYNSLVTSSTLPNLNPDNLSYKDFLLHDKKYLKSSKFEKDKAYFEDMFNTIPEPSTIYSKHNSSDIFCHTSDRVNFKLDNELIEKIKTLCSSLNISLYNFFMAVFGIYIKHSSRLDDFVIGMPISNRTNFKEKNTFGMYTNIVPFRMTIDGTSNFSDFSLKIAQNTFSCLRHQKYSYQYILESLRKKNPSTPNLYNIMISYETSKSSDRGEDFDTIFTFNHCINNDLSIHIRNVNNENIINISYDFNLNKYDKSDIDLIHPRILNIINQVLTNKEILLNDIEIITENEKDKIISELNNTTTHYPRNDSIISLFEKQVALYPDNIAVCYKGQELTYSELNKMANSLANYLKKKDINPNDIISIYMEDSLEAIVSILAVLKLGAVYLPLDINYPLEKIDYILKDTNARFILHSSEFNIDFENNIQKILVDLNSKIFTRNSSFKSYQANPADFAFINYTSLDSQNPKGIMLSNKGIIRLVINSNYIKFSSKDKIIKTSQFCSPDSSFEMWSALLTGGELFLTKQGELLNSNYLNSYIKVNNANILFLPISIFNKIFGEASKVPDCLRYIITKEENLSFKFAQDICSSNPNLNIVNGYGPIENTIFSTTNTINKETLDLGVLPPYYPISNSKCYVVSSTGHLLPPNIPGELWVGGDRNFNWIF